MGSIPVPSTKKKGCPEVARLMTSFFVFHVFMYERLITDIGYPGIYSLSVKRGVSRISGSKPQLVRKKAGFHGQAHQNHNLSAKRQGFTDKHIKTTTCPQKGRVSRTSTSKPQLVRKKAGFHGQAHQNHNLSAKRQGFTDKHIKTTTCP